MILNHKDAISFIREDFILKPVKKSNVFELHQILINNLNIDTGFRKHLVAITNPTYIPCDNEFQINTFFKDALKKINSSESILSKAIIANLLIAYLQPFSDGNKRTSRMLGNAILISNRALPVSFIHTPKEEYIKAILSFYELLDPSYFKRLFLNELNNSFLRYIG